MFNSEFDENMEIYHINRDSSDNRILNLRTVTRTQNNWNTKAIGAYFHPHSGLFQSKIMKNGKLYLLGYFKTKKEAMAAYTEAKNKLHII